MFASPGVLERVMLESSRQLGSEQGPIWRTRGDGARVAYGTVAGHDVVAILPSNGVPAARRSAPALPRYIFRSPHEPAECRRCNVSFRAGSIACDGCYRLLHRRQASNMDVPSSPSLPHSRSAPKLERCIPARAMAEGTTAHTAEAAQATALSGRQTVPSLNHIKLRLSQ